MSRVLWLLLPLQLYAFSVFATYDTAHKEALKENKILMVLLTEHFDNSTKKLLAHLQNDPNISTRIAHKAIFVLIQKESISSYPIEMLYTTTYPALFFLDPLNELFICQPLYGAISKESIKHCIE